jgi:hypothetical protein
MLHKYKEIVYGLAFGLGAVIMDTAMDAHIEGQSFGAELIGHASMLLYRTLFLVFGLILGWLLWQKNKRERDFRHLAETLKRLQQECGRNAVLMHAKLQVLLTREDLHLSREAQELIRFVYERTQQLQALANEKEKLPPMAA